MAYQLWTSRVTGYRRRGTRLTEIRSLVGAAVNVRAVFEPLQCCPADANAIEMSEVLARLDFDLAGVKVTEEGDVVGFVEKAALRDGSVADHVDVAVLNPKRPAILKDNGELIPFIPMASVRHDGGESGEQHRKLAEVTVGYTYFEKGDILVAKITPCFENGKVAHLKSLSSEFGFGSTEFHVLKAGPDIDARYLYHAVCSPRFRLAGASSMTGSAGQRRVPAAFVSRYRISLPSLSNQKRIASILDRAKKIPRKRQEGSRLLGEFRRSMFMEMFGNPSSNEMGWLTVPLGDVISQAQYGTSALANTKGERFACATNEQHCIVWRDRS